MSSRQSSPLIFNTILCDIEPYCLRQTTVRRHCAYIGRNGAGCSVSLPWVRRAGGGLPQRLERSPGPPNQCWREGSPKRKKKSITILSNIYWVVLFIFYINPYWKYTILRSVSDPDPESGSVSRRAKIPLKIEKISCFEVLDVLFWELKASSVA